MSNSELANFVNEAIHDSSIVEQLNEIEKSYSSEPKKNYEEIVKLGASCGYHFSVSDCIEYMQEKEASQESSSLELEGGLVEAKHCGISGAECVAPVKLAGEAPLK